MTHFAYITHILYCTLYKLQTTCLCVKYFVKNLHRAEIIYTGGARGARDKYQVCAQLAIDHSACIGIQPDLSAHPIR